MRVHRIQLSKEGDSSFLWLHAASACPWVNVFSHCKSPGWFDGFHSINPCGFLALIVLGHSSHCEQSRCPGLHQQFLKLLNCSLVATLLGSKDALLYPVHMLLKLAPGQLAPPLTLRIKG